jgi:hypothetical protein
MPHSLFILSIVVVAAIAPPTAAAQQPGSAGATRPNLKVLQALPEAQLFSLMNLVADSLGVRCDYCHVQATPDLSRTPSNMGGWVWDRDDKPPKHTALEMMRMVVTLLHMPSRWDAAGAPAAAAAGAGRQRENARRDAAAIRGSRLDRLRERGRSSGPRGGRRHRHPRLG